MDITSILGLIVGIVLVIIVGIQPANLINFYDPASIAIVVGGTVAAVIASFPFSMLKEMGKHIKILFQGKKYDTGKLINTLVEMAQIARKMAYWPLKNRPIARRMFSFSGGL